MVAPFGRGSSLRLAECGSQAKLQTATGEWIVAYSLSIFILVDDISSLFHVHAWPHASANLMI